MTKFLQHMLSGAAVVFAFSFGVAAHAQDTEAEPPKAEEPRGEPDVIPEREPLPETIKPFEDLKKFGAPDTIYDPEGESDTEGDVDSAVDALLDATIDIPKERPDYSKLPESEERSVRLDALFERLQAEEDAEAANLIAEEVWAIWLESGSDSVNLLLRRGTAAQKRGDDRLARRMYDHVTTLAPDYAEGWARSARLAYEEEDLSRAMTEATQALILEPRQFYAHWTLGNIFEKIGRTEQAYETYKEANRLYPELLPVKERLEMMKGQVEGDVL
jgi:tetratricopeptide (TPR) repeat protein